MDTNKGSDKKIHLTISRNLLILLIAIGIAFLIVISFVLMRGYDHRSMIRREINLDQGRGGHMMRMHDRSQWNRPVNDDTSSDQATGTSTVR